MKQHRAASLIAVLTAACTLALMGCERNQEPASSGSSALEAPPLEAPPLEAPPLEAPPLEIPPGSPQVKLLKPGAEPRRELRYELAPGTEETLVMRMTMDMQTTTAGVATPEVKIPTIAMHMALRIKDKLSQSDTRYEFEILEAEVTERPGVDPMVVKMTQGSLDATKGLKGSAIVNSRGFNRDAKVDMPAGMTPQMKQMMSSTLQSMEQLSSPLPVEPVGVGARWELHQTIEQNAMTVGQVILFELVELQGNTGKLTAKLTQKAERQTMNLPGTQAELLGLTSHGSGELRFDLTKMVPSSNLTIDSEYSMSLEMNGQPQTIDARMSMNVSVSHPQSAD